MALTTMASLKSFQTIFLMGQNRPLFVHFRSFQTQILLKKLKALAGIELRLSE